MSIGLGLYRDNGKEAGTYHNRASIVITDKKMETTIIGYTLGSFRIRANFQHLGFSSALQF